MLGLKQSELETLRENLAYKTKQCDEYSLRCEIMAVWCSKGKTIGRLQALQLKCLLQLKKYKDWKKYSRSVLENRVKKFRKEKTRTILQAWLKAHKVWKVQKDKENFERAVKAEI
jgi:tRNA G10  N-methylase Trm11